MNNTDKLVPCPFCASDDVERDCLSRRGTVCVEPAVCCNNCDTLFQFGFEAVQPWAQITTTWNTRPTNPTIESLQSRVKGLEEALGRIACHESSVSDSHMECDNCKDAFLDDYVAVKNIARTTLESKER